ncbi:MAG: ATP-binding protein [Thiolinea sp.]
MASIFLLLEAVSASSESIGSSEKVLPVTADFFDGVRSSELHLPSALNCKLKVSGVKGQPPAEALTSVRRGSWAAFSLLAKEGYIHRNLVVVFTLPNGAMNHHGFSSDLAFSLTVITQQFPRISFPAIAASGVVSEDGAVYPVEHIQAKLKAALEVLPKDAHVFLPAGNKADVPASISQWCEQQGIQLHFIDRLEDACLTLGIKVRQLYRSNPFRGLEAFSLNDRSLFFGRNKEIEEATAQLKKRRDVGEPALLVLGASGSGKSSFVQAGLLHELIYCDLFPTDYQVRHSVFRPRQLKDYEEVPEDQGYFSRRLKKTLCEHWGETLEQDIPDGFLDVSSAIDALNHAIQASPRQLTARQTRYVWIIDQLEELFTWGWTDEEQHTFIELITALPARGIWILATLSSDFYAEYQSRAALFNYFRGDGQYDLLLPNRAALGSIVREPARLAELSFENRDGISLDERILNDAGVDSSVLPLLEFTLSRLYQERDKGHLLLTHHAYENMGKVQGAIGAWAQNVYEGLPAEQQKPELLQTLIRHITVVQTAEGLDKPGGVSDTAAVQQLSYRVSARAVLLSGLPESVHPLVRSLTGPNARLLMLEQDHDGQVLVRVTHEALLRNWPLVQQRIAQDSQQLALVQQLLHEQQRWQQAQDSDKKELLIPEGLRLKQARALSRDWGETLPKEVSHYIAVSDRQSAGRKRKIWLGSGVVLLLLVVATIFYWLGFVKPNINYYTNFHRPFGIPENFGDSLSRDERRTNNSHYAVTRNGWWGKITKVRSVNQYGHCVSEDNKLLKIWGGVYKQDELICELKYEYDKQDKIKREIGLGADKEQIYILDHSDEEDVKYYRGKYESYGISFEWDKNTGYANELKYFNIDYSIFIDYIEDSDGVNTQRNQFDNNGNLVKEEYFDRKNRPTEVHGFHSVHYHYNKYNNELERSFFDYHGDPAVNYEGGYHLQRNSYDEKGNKTVVAFFGSYFDLDRPVFNDKEGFYHLKSMKFDALGNQIEEAFFGTEGEPVIHIGKEYHLQRVKLDNQGNEIEVAFFGTEGEPILAEDDIYHLRRKKFDEQGNKIEEAYFGLKGEPVFAKDRSYHLRRAKFDEQGNKIEEAYFGLKGEPIFGEDDNDSELIENSRYHLRRAKFDDQGNEIEVAFFGTEGEPILDEDDIYHLRRAKFDEQGNEIEGAHFGLKGEPVIAKDENYHLWRTKFDDQENEIEEAYFGLNGEPVLNKDGYHLRREKLDDQENKIEEAYFGLKGKPVFAKDGSYHLRREKFDEQGNKIEEAYFGLEDEPVFARDENYHLWRKKFDGRGKVIEEAHFGIKGEPVFFNGENFHLWKEKLDPQGNTIERSLFGLKNEPVFFKDTHYHLLKKKFDDQNNQIEEAYFGLSGEPVDIIDDSYHLLRKKFDNLGNQIEEAYFGSFERPVLNKYSVHLWKSKFNYSLGSETERAYFGIDGESVLHKEKYHLWRSKFDDRGNETETAFFGLEGQPVLLDDGYHLWRSKFDDRGNETEKAYFGLEGEPVLSTEGLHLWRSKFDDRGNETETAYFGINDEPVLSKGGMHIVSDRYDEQNNLVDRSYTDTKKQPIRSSFGYAGRRMKYNQQKNEIERIYYGPDNEPTMSTFTDPEDLPNFATRRRTYDENGNMLSEELFDEKGEKIPDKKP